MQLLGCLMSRYLTETTDKEKLQVRRGTIDLLASHMKMRFVAPGDWIRIKLDLQHVVRQACGDAYLYSRRQAGELLEILHLQLLTRCIPPLLKSSHPLLDSLFCDGLLIPNPTSTSVNARFYSTNFM